MSISDYLTSEGFRAKEWREDLERLCENFHYLAARLARAVPDFDRDAEQAEKDTHADACYLADLAAALSAELERLVRIITP